MGAKAGPAVPAGMAYPTDGIADRQWPLLGPALEIMVASTPSRSSEACACDRSHPWASDAARSRHEGQALRA
jgi:hypothetical protein